MKSLARPSFWRAYRVLDAGIKKAARRIYQKFRENPQHPSLRFKKLAGTRDIWSVRVTAKVRAVGRRKGEEISWFWIGSHNDFDKLFS